MNSGKPLGGPRFCAYTYSPMRTGSAIIKLIANARQLAKFLLIAGDVLMSRRCAIEHTASFQANYEFHASC
jgi:hypothetical protein